MADSDPVTTEGEMPEIAILAREGQIYDCYQTPVSRRGAARWM